MRHATSLKLILLLFSFSTMAHAEGGCPDGMRPLQQPGQGGPQGCAPLPNSQQRGPNLPIPNWANRWGAIAADKDAPALGTSENVRSEDMAKSIAIANCQAQGGEKCILMTSYKNMCVSLSVGDSMLAHSRQITLALANEDSLRECSRIDDNCEVIYSGCSQAERIL